MLSKILLTAPLALGFVVATSISQPAESQRRASAASCLAGEQPVFACRAGQRAITLCGTPRGAEITGVTYRMQNNGRTELTYGRTPRERMDWGYRGYSGGGEAQAMFDRGGYKYVVFSRVVRTGFETTNNPRFDAGVLVQRGGRTLQTIRCTAPRGADIDVNMMERLLPTHRTDALVDH